ncbi:hypothetical protein MNBD_GAMMA26-700 [hydrothermal vent metagenome]|uniref:Uncharacterized protein n=1 Tax=hydrothermal vent metagenome TaxID=652676 RepID=A0A3B1AX19_9ZZZZ
MNLFAYLIVAGSLLSVTACSQSQTDRIESGSPQGIMPIKISLLGEKDQLLASVTDRQKAGKIIALMNAKKPLLEKMMPIFKMKLIIERGEGKEVWLLAKPGYLRQQIPGDNQVFYMDKNNQLLELLLDSTTQP